MAVMLERWNDDKMDALAAKVDDLGILMREQRMEMREQRSEMNARFDSLQRMMITAAIMLSVGFFAGVISLIVTQG